MCRLCIILQNLLVLTSHLHTGSEPHPIFSTIEVLRPLFMVSLSHSQLIECVRPFTVLLTIHLALRKNMGLGIVEPKRQGTHVPATAILLHDDLMGATGRYDSEVVLVPQPSDDPNDPLVNDFCT